MIKLSICIPTYNRAEYLSALLDSIFDQRIPYVEVVVCDNNSTDDTSKIIRRYQQIYKNLTYFKNDQNMGFDANVLRAVSLARAPYCWLIGDDDILYEDSLGYVLEAIKTNLPFYLVSFDIYDSKMRFLQKGAYLSKVKDGSVFNMADTKQIAGYLSKVKANAGLFGYMGAAVFRKDIWKKVRGYEAVQGLGWIHVYMLWYFKNFFCTFKFLQKPLIKVRMQYGNTTQPKTRVERLLAEFKGLEITAKELFKDDKKLYNAFLSAVARYTAPSSIPPVFIAKKSDKRKWAELIRYIKMYPYPKSFKKRLSSGWRINPVYFLREFINLPAMRYVKKPFKFIKDLIKG